MRDERMKFSAEQNVIGMVEYNILSTKSACLQFGDVA